MKKEDQDKLSIYFKDVRKYKILSEEELLILFNDNQFDKIILHNQRLIISIAQNYPYIQIEDAIQSANEYIHINLPKYNKEVTIITFLYTYAKYGIMDFIYKNARTIRLPRNLLIEMKNDPDNKYFQSMKNLNDKVNNESDDEFQDLIEDEDCIEYDDEKDKQKEIINYHLSTMTKEDNQLYKLILEDYSIQEIADILNITYQIANSRKIKLIKTIKEKITNQITDKAFIDDLRHYLPKLKERYQFILKSYYIEDMNFREIGNQLGITHQAIEQQHQLAIGKLEKLKQQQ